MCVAQTGFVCIVLNTHSSACRTCSIICITVNNDVWSQAVSFKLLTGKLIHLEPKLFDPYSWCTPTWKYQNTGEKYKFESQNVKLFIVCLFFFPPTDEYEEAIKVLYQC